MIFGPAERLDPLRRPDMFRGTLCPRQLGVGNLPDEHVQECVLRVIGNRRKALAADEVPAYKPVQPFLDRPAVQTRHRRQTW